MSQTLRFLRRFLDSPQAIGSVMPSSPALVKAMLAGVDWGRVSTVAELGGGTGVISGRINALRSADSCFLCFENDPDMHLQLSRNFRDVLFERDAFTIRQALEKHQLSGLDCVVSGLPLVNFPRVKRHRLLKDIYAVLNPGGMFVAFQYTRQLQSSLASIYDSTDRQYVWANLPPAFVFVCRKRLAVDDVQGVNDSCHLPHPVADSGIAGP
jgi:phospholipid N-methyltransferase